MGRASSNPKSTTSCPMPNKTNGEAGGGGGGLEEEEEDDLEPASPPRRTTRLRTKAAAATSTTTTTTNDAVSAAVAETPIEDKAEDVEEEVEIVRKKRTRQKELKTKKVSKNRERKTSSKDSDVIVTTPVARRSQRVVHKLSGVNIILCLTVPKSWTILQNNDT